METGDRVIVFAAADAVDDVASLFQETAARSLRRGLLPGIRHRGCLYMNVRTSLPDLGFGLRIFRAVLSFTKSALVARNLSLLTLL